MINASQLLRFGFFLLWVAQDFYTVFSRSPFSYRSRSSPAAATFVRPSSLQQSISTFARGGAKDDQEVEESDDERYSRQVYTLGARAHGLVRSSTVYVDGPSSSGLVFECVKNLALSGVGNIVLWSSDDATDANYHDHVLDDLGKAYQRGAREELNVKEGDHSVPPEQILEDYIRRLNPVVRVSRANRPESMSEQKSGVILCVDRPYGTQVVLNKLAREQTLKYVAVETAGVYGRVFCDFGPDFEVYDADGETPLVTPLVLVEPSGDEGDENGTFLVNSMDTEKHDVSAGDTIEFQLSTGDVMDIRCTVVKVITPYQIKVKLDSDYSTKTNEFADMVNQQAASFGRVKIPTYISFVSLEDAMQASDIEKAALFAPCDLDKSFDEVRRSSVLSCFQALSAYVQQEDSLPTSLTRDTFEKLVGTFCPSEKKLSAGKRHTKKFVSCCAGKLTPLQAMFGAMGAQEAIKAVTGLYNPVKQILLYDCDELLVDHEEGDECKNQSQTKQSEKRTGLTHILGDKLEKKVKSARLFVVGAGAIGCEVLKNLAAMGVATSSKGCISLTDMDTIERSNLSRQLLFRDSNIGQFKSEAAKGAILRMNPAVNMNVYTNKVGEESTSPFDDAFWSSGIDAVLNALDNMEARLFMDRQCVSNKKAMVDAGTLGSKGNVQVVVPHQSESYGSSVDPPEPAIPVCTLKNFPYAIAHTIQWGRDLFDGLHQRRPRQANDVAESLSSSGPNEITRGLLRDLGDEAAVEAAVEIADDLLLAAGDKQLSEAKAETLQWTANLAIRLFYRAIVDLLQEHPPDSVDEDGEHFWTRTRKVPTPVLFSPIAAIDEPAKLVANENMLEFVQSGARLRLEMLFGENVDCSVGTEEARKALLAAQDAEDSSPHTKDNQDSPEETILSHLRSIPDGAKHDLKAVDFEKDDEANGHVQFVNAASNLRAICYGIPPATAMETRRVAGKIVPAMITTTAVVSALSCIEFLKLLQKAPLPKHRNAFINLALPFFAFTMPVPAEEMHGPSGTSFTMWDIIAIKETKKKTGETKTLTLKRFMISLKKALSHDAENLEVASISAGQYMIYANFLHEDDEDMMRQSIFKLVHEASEEEDAEFAGRSGDEEHHTVISTEDGGRLQLTVTVEDTVTGEEYELPPVHVTRDG